MLYNKIKDTIGILADMNLLEKDGLKYIEIIIATSTYQVSYHGEYHYRSGNFCRVIILHNSTEAVYGMLCKNRKIWR